MSERKEKNIKQDYYKLQTDLKNMQKKNSAGLPQGNSPKEVCQLCQRENHTAIQCKKSPVAIAKDSSNSPLMANSPLITKNSEQEKKLLNINSINVPKYVTVIMLIENIPCHMMIDSGAARTLVSDRWVKRFLRCLPEPVTTNGMQLIAANRTLIDIPFKLPQVEIAVNNTSARSDILIMPNIPDDCEGMLGLEMLTALNIQLDFSQLNLATPKGQKEFQAHDFYPCDLKLNPANKKIAEEVEIITEATQEEEQSNDPEIQPKAKTETYPKEEELKLEVCTMYEETIIPGYSQTLLPVRLSKNYSQDVLIEGLPPKDVHYIKIGKSLVKGNQEIVYVPCLNLSQEPVVLPQNEVAGWVSLIDYSSGPDVLVPPSQKDNIKFNLDHLETNKKEQMLALLNKNLDVFSKNRTDLGRTPLCEHEINVENIEPIRQYPRRKSPEARRLEEELIQQMLEGDVIRPSMSPWASPILLTKKADGSTRFCIDFRKVNAVTKKDSYPISNITESLETLKDAKWFSIMDLQSGFWQVPIKESHKEITAFTTGRKLYEFQVLPFGLSNSPATFSRLMEKVLENLQWEICLIYIDDILVFAKTYPELLERTQLIFDRLRAANLKLKPSKCQFGIKEVKYLGFVVSEKGISVDLNKIEPILRIPPPTTLKEVRSFLGMAGYYRRFIKDFSKIANPITKLTHQDSEIIWSEECDKAFEEMKDKLTTAPVLAYPDYSKEFILSTDASSVGLGAVLSQYDSEGKEHPVAFASRTLNNAEINYSTTKRECLALIWAVQHFHPYLYSQKDFTIITDHHSLSWLNQNKASNCLLARWAMILEGYHYNVKYRPGTQMGHADGLSRLPTEQPDGTAPLQAELEYIASLQTNEEEQIKRWLNGEGELPAQLQILKQQNVKIENDNIYVNNRSYVPRERLREVMERIHSHPLASAHFSYKKTFDKFKNFFYSPQAYLVAKEVCDLCLVCQVSRTSNQTARTELGTVKALHRWEIISIDISGPFPETKEFKRYILTVVDLFTKYTILIPIMDMTASTVAKGLVRDVFAHYSIPKEILSDQGRQFEGYLFKELCELLQIHKIRTSKYHPQGNAVNERNHAIVNDLLRKFIIENEDIEWDELLPMVMLALNSNLQETINYTPYEAMFGKKPQLPDDLIYGKTPIRDHTKMEAIQQLQFQLEVISQRILTQQSRVHLAQARQYSKKGQGTWYEPGDYVLIKYVPKSGENPKLAPRWEGPYLVLNTNRFPVLEIVRPDQSEEPFFLHHDRLKLCKIDKENNYLKNFPTKGTYFRKNISTYPIPNKPSPAADSPSSDDETLSESHQSQNSAEEEFMDPEEIPIISVRSPEAMERYDLRPRPTKVNPFNLNYLTNSKL